MAAICLGRCDRALELAIDYAAALIEGTDDEVEPDGLPNALGIPVSTLHSNIWYHLGLARYLKGDYEGAVQAYGRGLEVSRGPDNVVSTTHWLYMALRRLGRRPRSLGRHLGPSRAASRTSRRPGPRRTA